MASAERPLAYWFLKAGLTSPEAVPVEDLGVRDLDVVTLEDGRAVWAQFYGEAPRESIYKGTEGTKLKGHIHFEDDFTYESYLLTLDGPVLRVVSDKHAGTVLEGPTEVDHVQQSEIIELLDPHYYPVQ